MEQLTGTMSSVPNSNNYENMSHKPQINGVELTGNKTSEERNESSEEWNESSEEFAVCSVDDFSISSGAKSVCKPNKVKENSQL